MPYIPTETIVSAAILAALIAGWRYVQQNPQQQEAIPAAIKKTANAVLPGGKGLFEDELTGESASGSGKKSKAGSKKSASKKKKNGAAVVGDASGKEDGASSARVEPEPEVETKAPAPVSTQSKATKEKPKTLAEKKVKKAPKTEVDDMLPEDQKQPQIARVMKIVPEQSTSTPSAPTPASAPAQEEPAAATQAANEDFGYEDEDAELDESEEDDGWEVPKKFVGSGNANGGSFAAIAGSSRAPSAPSLNRFSLLTSSNPNFPQSPSTRRTTSSQRPSSSAADNSAPTKVQRKNANKREAQKLQKEQEEKERLDRLKSYRAEAAKERAGAGGKRDALGKPVENWGSQAPFNPTSFPPPLPITLDTVTSTIFNFFFALMVPVAVQSGLQLFFLVRPESPTSRSIYFWARVYSDVGFFIGIARYLGKCYNNQQKVFGKKEKVVWEDQIVVVTGGASGVGALLVRTLASLGATVIVLDINQCEDENANVWSYVCDVSNYDAVIDVAQKIRDEIGSPTMLVNNAGVVSGKLILDLEARDVERTFGVNVLSHFWTIKAFLPGMLENGKGHIVTVASVLGLAGSAQMVDYCASKAALITMHDALRFELNNRYKAPQIRTTLLLPGHIRTPLFDKIQFPRSLFFRFMAPSLEPGQVVQKIVRALAAQESRVVRMPFYTHSARLLNLGSGLTPGWIRDFLQWMSQADFAMERYHPK